MSSATLARLVTTLSCAAFVSIGQLAAEPAALPRYTAALGESSISGISSGAYMAIQFATAWSSVIKGVGVVAGGPFWCAQADAGDAFNWYTLPQMNAIGPCMAGPPPDLSFLITKADAKAASGDIDPLQNLKRQKVYLFHGYSDAVVAKSATDAAVDFYGHYVGKANRGNLYYYQTAVGAGHSLVVLQEPDVTGLNDCTANSAPFIDRCGYDRAGIILQHIYGALNPPSRGQLSGTMQRFDQSL
jgi:poly(3-hydroxybutyrate) depolymerase